MKRIALIAAALGLVLAGCGGGDSTTDGAADAGAPTVRIVDFKYAPAELTVPAGTTVTFVNDDSAGHTATSEQSGAFDTGGIDRGESGKVTLEKSGTFAYICAFHPFMKGSITVE